MPAPTDATAPTGFGGAARVERSSALHQAVLEFSRRERPERSAFEELARELYSFQASCQGKVALGALQGPLLGLSAVPTDVFRYATPFNFRAEDGVVAFQTSGTSTPHPGHHLMRSTSTYRELALAFGRRRLLQALPAESRRPRVLALMPPPAGGVRSSLAFMSAAFMSEFDGRGLANRTRAGFDLEESGRWLLRGQRIDLTELSQQLDFARACAEPVLLLSTSFALVMLFDALEEKPLSLPAGSIVMTTGGFKGRTREVDSAQLYQQTFDKLGPDKIVGEYGMTELSSQLYEQPTIRGDGGGSIGLFFEPSWLRVFPLDPATHLPVADGQVGLACFVDLGNVDSAVCVLTQDLVCREAGGVRLLGRASGAIVRGCSLAVEELWTSPAPQPTQENKRAFADSKILGSAMFRVRRLLRAAAKVRDRASEFGQGVRQQWTTEHGWPPEAVELGIEHSLEHAVSDEQLRRFCQSVDAAPRVWVNLSSNMPVAALRAIALGLAASERVFVRASRRDPVLANALFEAMQGAGEPSFELVQELRPEPGDRVYAYGADDTLSELRRRMPGGVQFQGHGSGFGAVVLYPGDELDVAARGVAIDMVVFDQQGCLSPRVAIAQTAVDVSRFVTTLTTTLENFQRRVPLGLAARSIRGELLWSRATFGAVAELFEAGSGFVAVQREPAPLILAPAARNLVVYCCEDPAELLRRLAPRLTTFGCGSSAPRAELCTAAPRARATAIGMLQKPEFDGPVDRRAV